MLINQIDIWIKRAEETWLEMLHKHAEGLFSNTFLPSHDHTHHSRVWNICKRLFSEINRFNSLLDFSLVEGVLIATYFHDLGMVLSTREEHGILGREICEAYFREQVLNPPSRFTEILEAIEAHDNKEGAACAVILPGESVGILTVISIADDLEALGIIGIYRYIEIYLKRKIDLKNLGNRILENAGNRFKNISERCIHCPSLMQEYSQHYFSLVRFFDHYNQQLMDEPPAKEVFHGHLGIVNYIRILSVEGETRPEDYLKEVGRDKADAMVRNYFTELNHELVKARL